MMLPLLRGAPPASATPASRAQAPGVTPSVCTPHDNQVTGQCFDHNGPVPGAFNCAACCALRGAVGWHNAQTGAVVAC